VSLILDALRKLERDRERPDPGVVVLGSVPWPGLGRSRRRSALVASAVLGLAVLAAAGIWLLRSAPAKSPAVHALTPLPVKASPAPAAVSPRAAVPPPTTTVAAPAAPTRSAPGVATLGPPPAGRRLAVPGSAAADADRPARRPAGATEGPPAAAAPHDRLQLMVISERDGQAVAIISDHLVHEGDSFDGVKVLRIGATEVEVDDRGQRRVLHF
jgi:hypothetical protein